jgi:WD40 repeat protein
MSVFKFADPISVGRVSSTFNMLFTASWDKMIRCIDLETNKVVKSFIASKEAIKTMQVTDKYIFVAGIEPIIRAFNIEDGSTKLFQGHKGWVYTIEIEESKNRMYSGGDDRTIIIWNIENTKMLEQLTGHENGVTSIGFAAGDLYTGSFDHHVICWDLNDLEDRISEKEDMRQADIESRRYETYWKLMDAKKGKKKRGKGGAKKAGGAAKKKKK